MNMGKLAALAVLMTFGAAHAQEEAQQVELKVIVAGDGGDAKEFRWVGDDAGLHDLAIGESRTITAEDGSQVVVTRTDDGMQFDIGDETVVLPEPPPPHMAFHGAHGMSSIAIIDGDGEDVAVTSGGVHVARAHHPDGVTIISAEKLDDSVKESIRSVLISAGVDDEVTFIDGSENRQVRVISKRVEVTQ